MPREILTDWVTPSGSGFVTVTWFETADPVAPQRTSLAGLWFALKPSISNLFSYSIRDAGREVDDATGALTGAWAEPTAHTGVGTSSNEPIPDATQVLLRFQTGVVAGSHMVQGRIFVPGIIVQATDNGALTSAALTSFSSIANDFATDGVGFGIWHRPILGAGGSHIPTISGSAWQELAVLRRRR